jgi:hypothetical protein
VIVVHLEVWMRDGRAGLGSKTLEQRQWIGEVIA